ncbi:DedA family protein/thiosulfate sulfurtransferase GlpE [Pandoraea sputorum]|uniref:DedA family protein/thiosulfate sulfurtransferase GlpE n=1 Tax=Pandoraea sputorum TaxID=93222 RepID=UPI00123EF6F8|nr:DedA family protein/thiosulfate sulfurtransferase GlpE [Pandoraea sputorum]BET12477.1 DedA family protein/thiosulfate sulfurtransferase GlpE [Pandoraea sputorum]VVE80330.1 membrane protein [Pandoraea sputorum]
MLFDLIARFGLWLVFLNIFGQALGLPLPAYPTLIVTASTSLFPPLSIVALAVFAALLGDALWFLAGRRYGHHILRLMCRLSISPDTCVSRTEGAIGRHGVRVLMFARFVPGLSALSVPMAGALGVSWRKFLMYDAIGAVLWSGLAVALGVGFASHIVAVLDAFDTLGRGVLWLVVLIFALYLLNRWLNRYRLLRSLRMARIGVQTLESWMKDDITPVVIDVRSAARRAVDPFTIPGAMAIEPDEIVAKLKDIPRDRRIVVFCACPNEVTAAKLAQELRRQGFSEVRPLLGGLDAWRDAGYTVEKIDGMEMLVPAH